MQKSTWVDLYFKSKLFEKLVQLDSCDPEVVTTTVSNISDLIKDFEK
jgi:hypothetical protein